MAGDRTSLNKEIQDRLNRLSGELSAAFGADLVSIVLYGSAARGDHFGSSGSDLNVVVVVSDISLASLERATRATRAWEGSGNRPLLFFSPEWIRRSCDVFPMEFLDILDAHVVVQGDDPFAGLEVSHENLRLQCESELKTKLIHLRTGYMQLHEETSALARALAASYGPILAVARGVLRLGGGPVPQHGEEAIALVAKACRLDPAPFVEVAALKRGGAPAASMDVKGLYRRYYDQIERMARAVDAGLKEENRR